MAGLAFWSPRLIGIQALPLSPEVKHINANGVSALAQDVQYLTEFVSSLENGQMLRENLDELQQTVNLLQSENNEEFFDVSVRNKKYGRVDALNGPTLLEKYDLESRTRLGKLNTNESYVGSRQSRRVPGEALRSRICPHVSA